MPSEPDKTKYDQQEPPNMTEPTTPTRWRPRFSGMRQSMSRADSCYDNAFMESCFGTIKMELEMDYYESEVVARREIGQYIRYYNTRRRHSALGYLTPEQFEAKSDPGEGNS